MDLDALSRELARKFGEDAAQHALMRVVEKGWHLTPGANEVERFAKVCAHHFKLTQVMRDARRGEFPLMTQRANALALAEARQELSRLDPLLVDAAFWGSEEAAQMHGVSPITARTRKHKLGLPKVRGRARPSSSR